MKHAFLIGAFANPDYLDKLVQSLQSERSNIYIHINKKNIRDFTDFCRKYELVDNVHVISTVKVIWGGATFLKSVKCMLDLAFENKENEFFHLISGADALLKPLNELFDFFSKNSDKNYMHYREYPSEIWWRGGVERYKFYHVYDYFNCRVNGFGKWLDSKLVRIQRRLNINRPPMPFEKLYSGWCWWSINRSGAAEIHAKLNDEVLWKYLDFTFAPEEVVFQNILLNSKIKDSVVNNYLRYIDFPIGANSPRILTENNYADIVSSGALFIRKVDPILSRDLLLKLEITH